MLVETSHGWEVVKLGVSAEKYQGCELLYFWKDPKEFLFVDGRQRVKLQASRAGSRFLFPVL